MGKSNRDLSSDVKEIGSIMMCKHSATTVFTHPRVSEDNSSNAETVTVTSLPCQRRHDAKTISSSQLWVDQNPDSIITQDKLDKSKSK